MPNELKIVIDADAQPATTEIKNFGKVFTGEFNKISASASSLNQEIAASIAKINSSLSGLKVTSIDVGVNTSSVDASIKSIQSKFSTLVDPELNVLADTQLAETKIKELLAELSALKDSEVFITANDSQALGKINEIKTELTSLLDKQIKLNINSADAFQKISALEKELIDLQALAIDPNISSTQLAVFEANIKRVRAEIAALKGGGVIIPIGANVSTAISELKALKSDVSSLSKKRVTVPIDANTDKAIAFVEKFRKSLDGLATGSIAQLKKAASLLRNELENLSSVDLKGSFARQLSDSLKVVNTELKGLEKQAQLTAEKSDKSLSKLSNRFNDLKVLIPGIAIGAIAGFATKAIDSIIDALFNATSAAEKFNEAFAKDASKGVATLEFIRAKLNDLTIPLAKRVELAKQYNETADKSNQIDLKSLDNINLTNASITQQIGLILERAKARAAEALLAEKFEKLFKQQAEFELKFPQFQTTEIDKLFTQAQKTIDFRANKLGIKDKIDPNELIAVADLPIKTIETLAKTSSKFRLLLDENTRNTLRNINAQTTKIKQYRDGIGELAGGVQRRVVEIQQTNKEINEILSQFGKGIDIKGFIDFKKLELPKDQTDAIIARARQFVKEFGDSFVVPDLTESFFKTKKEVLEQSIKLLSDIQHNRLKIKIPVITDFEFLPTETQLTDAQIKELTSGFFDGIRIERNIPLDVTLDPTLAKGNLDAILKKLDLRKQFSVLGDLGLKEFDKIDFSNINEGITEATKGLQGMMDIALTLNQAIGQGLSNAFNEVFDAVLEGKSVFKALGEAIKQLVVGTIKAIAQMLILKAITNLIFPGGGGFIGAGRGAIGGIPFGTFGQANFGGIGSSPFSNVIQIVGSSRISGNDIVTSYIRSTNSSGRFG